MPEADCEMDDHRVVQYCTAPGEAKTWPTPTPRAGEEAAPRVLAVCAPRSAMRLPAELPQWLSEPPLAAPLAAKPAFEAATGSALGAVTPVAQKCGNRGYPDGVLSVWSDFVRGGKPWKSLKAAAKKIQWTNQ